MLQGHESLPQPLTLTDVFATPLAQSNVAPPYKRYTVSSVAGSFWNHDCCVPRDRISPSTTYFNAPTNLSTVVTRNEWETFWSRVESIQKSIQRYEQMYNKSCCIVLYTVWLGPTVLHMLHNHIDDFPHDKVEVSTWISMAILYMFSSLWISVLRQGWWQVLRLICSDFNEQLSTRGWTVEVDYERGVDGILVLWQGFRIYFVPQRNELNEASYLRIPVSNRWFWTWTPMVSDSYQFLPNGPFDTLNDGAWSRFWVDWRSESTWYLWTHRLAIVLVVLCVVFLGVSLKWERAGVIGFVVTIIPLLCTMVLKTNALVQRNKVVNQYVNDFCHQGVYFEFRSVAHVGHCGLEFADYLYLTKFPSLDFTSPTVESTPGQLV